MNDTIWCMHRLRLITLHAAGLRWPLQNMIKLHMAISIVCACFEIVSPLIQPAGEWKSCAALNISQHLRAWLAIQQIIP